MNIDIEDINKIEKKTQSIFNTMEDNLQIYTTIIFDETDIFPGEYHNIPI